MSQDYDEYERKCNRIRKENEKLLNDFAQWLAQTNLKDKTIQNHIQNVDVYLNDFLLYEDTVEAKDGWEDIDMFLGYWFIKKCLWASSAQIKASAASLKKFYTFIHQKGLLNQEDLQEFKEMIKEGMPEWIATMERYDDPSIEDMSEVWGL